MSGRIEPRHPDAERYAALRADLHQMGEARRRYELARLRRRFSDLKDELGTIYAQYACPECDSLPSIRPDGRDGYRAFLDNCEEWCPRLWMQEDKDAEDALVEAASLARRHRADPRYDGYLPTRVVLPALATLRCPDCQTTPEMFVHPVTEDSTVYYACPPSCPNR